MLTAPVFRLLRSDKPARYFWKAKQKGVLQFFSWLLPSHQLVFIPNPLTHGLFSCPLPSSLQPAALLQTPVSMKRCRKWCPPSPLSALASHVWDESRKHQGEGDMRAAVAGDSRGVILPQRHGFCSTHCGVTSARISFCTQESPMGSVSGDLEVSFWQAGTLCFLSLHRY